MIPSDRYINRDDLVVLDPLHIVDAFKREFKVPLHCFSVIRPMIRDLFDSLNDVDVLLVPGDSPFKIIQTMRINHEIGQNLFMFNGVVKRITIADFPLSGAGHIRSEELDPYLLHQLASNNVPLNSNFAMYDYSSSGSTYEALRESLARLRRVSAPPLSNIFDVTHYRDPVLSLIHIDLDGNKIAESPELAHTAFNYYFSPEYWNATPEERQRVQGLRDAQLSPCKQLYDNAVIDAEMTGSRCVVSRNFARVSVIGSLYKCNLVIAMMALAESGAI